MPTAKDNKKLLLDLLPVALDDVLKSSGFSRSQKSSNYVCKLSQCRQEFHLFFDSNPSYASGALLHLLPSASIRMPSVGEIATKLSGDQNLLGRNPDLIIAHQIQNLAPNGTYPRWLVSDGESFRQTLNEVADCFTRWVNPFFKDYSSPEMLIRQYEAGDNRPIRSHQFFFYIACCYLLQGKREKAAEVLDAHLNKAGLKKIYGKIFQELTKMHERVSISP